MTLVKLNQRPSERRVNAFFEDFFNQFPSKSLNEDFSTGRGSVPVNIKQTEQAYLLEVVAPGMEKSDFKINVDKNILTISSEKKNESVQENEKQVRREYAYQSFTRTFTVDETIDAEKIVAKYENGVLHIELPKKEEARIQPKEISIQ